MGAMDDGESCTTMKMFLVSLNCIVKYGYNSMFILCDFYIIKNIFFT